MLDILGDPTSYGRGDRGRRRRRCPSPRPSSSPDASSTRPTSISAAVVVNRVLPELFGRGEEESFDDLRATGAGGRARGRGRPGSSQPVLDAAELAVRLRRTRAGHLTRLRDGTSRDGPTCSTSPSCSRAHTACAPRSWSPRHSGRSWGSDGRAATKQRYRIGHARAAARDEGDRHPLRFGRRRQDDDRRGGCCGGGRSPRRQGARPHRRSGAKAGQRARARAVRQRRDARAARGVRRARESSRVASCTPPCSTPSSRGTTSFAVMHRTRRPATRSSPIRCTRTSRAGSCRATTTSRWSGCYEIHVSGRYDLIVVDTPPTRNALDFLEAPERMADFFSSRFLRWLTVPSRSRC